MSRDSFLTNEEIYTLLEMRSNGITYRNIGKELGVSEQMISRKYSGMLANFNDGYVTRVSEVAKAAGKPFSLIVSMLKCKIDFFKTRKKDPIMIRINNDNLPKNIWYSNKGGRVFDASRQGVDYIVQDKPLFKVDPDHCTIYKPN